MELTMFGWFVGSLPVVYRKNWRTAVSVYSVSGLQEKNEEAMGELVESVWEIGRQDQGRVVVPNDSVSGL
jgi:hypothetical protein